MDGQKLKAARRKAALSLRGLADLAGVGYVTLHRIENGAVKDAYPTTLRKIADALKVEPVDLMSETDSDRTAPTP